MPDYGPCDDFTTPPGVVWQNPDVSGYPDGWKSCTCFAAAGTGREATCGHRNPTGGAIRELTHDHTAGTTLAQVDLALERGWGIDLDVRYGLDWQTFVAKVSSGRPAILQGHGEAFIGTKFFANASVNHAVYVPGGDNWRAIVDPAADGRRPDIYKSHGELYPEALLRKFAGLLILDFKTRRRLGSGRVYAAFGRDTTANHEAVIRPLAGMQTRQFTTYDVQPTVDGDRVIHGKPTVRRTSGFAIPCSDPKRVHTASGRASVSLVKLIHPGHPQDGWWVSSRWERET